MVVDVGDNNHHVLQYFGLKAEEAPTLRFINMETTKKYTPSDGGPVTAASVTAFCHAVLNGKVKVRAGWHTQGMGMGTAALRRHLQQSALPGFSQPYLLSQEVPADWDQRPVKTLVGKNFEQVAFDETKNVFIKFCKCGQWRTVSGWVVGGRAGYANAPLC